MKLNRELLAYAAAVLLVVLYDMKCRHLENRWKWNAISCYEIKHIQTLRKMKSRNRHYGYRTAYFNYTYHVSPMAYKKPTKVSCNFYHFWPTVKVLASGALLTRAVVSVSTSRDAPTSRSRQKMTTSRSRLFYVSRPRRYFRLNYASHINKMSQISSRYLWQC